jgi:hypothetical protein
MRSATGATPRFACLEFVGTAGALSKNKPSQKIVTPEDRISTVYAGCKELRVSSSAVCHVRRVPYDLMVMLLVAHDMPDIGTAHPHMS